MVYYKHVIWFVMYRLIGEAAEKVEAARERDAASLAKEREADARLSAAAAAEEQIRTEAAAVKAAADSAEQDAKNANRVRDSALHRVPFKSACTRPACTHHRRKQYTLMA